MQNHKWKTKWGTLGLAVVALASSLAPSKAQAQENFAWITNTNGVTWKMEIDKNGSLDFWRTPCDSVVQILVPEHALITGIDVAGCANLTNIILLPATTGRPEPLPPGWERPIWGDLLSIEAVNSGLRNITCQKTMRDLISLRRFFLRFHEGEWAKTVQWTKLELPQIEIKARTTPNGKELEVIWREGNLQIADAVNGKWKDYSGNSPLRIPLRVPLWLDAKPQQFFRIKKRESTTPQQ